MDFSIPAEMNEEGKRLQSFLAGHLLPSVGLWHAQGVIPRSFFLELGRDGWLGFQSSQQGLVERSSLWQALLFRSLGKISPGVAVAVAVHVSLGMKGLFLYDRMHKKKSSSPRP